MMKDVRVQPTKKYRDRQGKMRWQGTSQLTSTGFLGCNYVFYSVCNLCVACC